MRIIQQVPLRLKGHLFINAVIAAMVTISTALSCAGGISEQEQKRYDSGYAHPSMAGAHLVMASLGTTIDCAYMGLTRAECPQYTTEIAKRFVASLMTQQIQFHGPGQFGEAYTQEYSRVINHLFYELIDQLQETPCSRISRPHIPPETMRILQQAEFIHRCDAGWKINSDWLAVIDR